MSQSANGVPITFWTDPTVTFAAGGRGRRYKLRFPSTEALHAALADELPTVYRTAVHSSRRAFLSVELPTAAGEVRSSVQNEAATLTLFEREYGARAVEDFRYDLESMDLFGPETFQPEDTARASLEDVLKKIRATECWGDARGEGIAIAVVDTGIDGQRGEIAPRRRIGGWAPEGEDPWTDWKGHGTMCAVIAAGSRADGGRYDGVAPDASVLACRTRFYDSELAVIYDHLTDLAKGGLRIVATNSFGLRVGAPPAPPTDSDFLPALDDAIRAGVLACFSAGNYHLLAGGGPDGCEPTSIWLHKCRADVLTVGTCRLDGSMWGYSSRGLGQHHGESAAYAAKPDVIAPTPAFGRIAYGGDDVVMPEGWGTSGACPQAAGLAALLLQRNPGRDGAEVFGAIRDTASPVGHGPSCEGAGIIDCRAALDAL